MDGQKPIPKKPWLQWTVLRLAFGKTCKGWKAGPNKGFAVHHHGSSKPCKTVLTKDHLICPFCQNNESRGFVGYCPMISQDDERFVVIYGADYEERISEVQYGDQIVVTKGRFKAAPVVVRQQNWTIGHCSKLERAQYQEDISPWLLQLWGDTQLQAFFGMKPELIPITKNQSVGKTQGPDDVPTGRPLRGSLSGIIDRLGTDPDLGPGRNGKHKQTHNDREE